MADQNLRDIDVYINENMKEGGIVTSGVSSVNGMTGDVTIDKKTLGIENVDNTSDLNKPVSIATQAALNAKANSSDVTEISSKATKALEDVTAVNNDLQAFKASSEKALEDVESNITKSVSEAVTGVQVDITELHSSLQGYIGTKNILNYPSIKEDATYGTLCSVGDDGGVTIANTLSISVTPYTTKQYLNAETYTFSITSDTAGLTYFVGRGDTILSQEQTVVGTKTFTFTNAARVKIRVGVMVPAGTTAKVFLQIEKGEEATSFVKSSASANDYLDRLKFGENTGVGSGALDRLTAGVNNTAVGENALKELRTATDNTAVGANTLEKVNTGVNNTAVGSNSMKETTGESNTAVGGYSLMMNSTGKNNTAVGAYANITGQTFDNTTAIGAHSAVTGENQVQLGDSNTNVYTYGAVQNRSDQRDKIDIADTDLGLEFIRMLKARKYRHDFRSAYDEYVPVYDDCGCLTGYNKVEHTPDGSKAGSRFHYGLIAQEVKETLDFLGVDWAGYQDHSLNGGADIKTIGYTECIAPIIKAIQEVDSVTSTNSNLLKYTKSIIEGYDYETGAEVVNDNKNKKVADALAILEGVVQDAIYGVEKNKERVNKIDEVISRASNTWIISDYLKEAIHYVCGAGEPEENGYSADDYNDENGYGEPYLDVITGTVYHAIRTKDSPLTYGWVVKEQLTSVQDKFAVTEGNISIPSMATGTRSDNKVRRTGNTVHISMGYSGNTQGNKLGNVPAGFRPSVHRYLTAMGNIAGTYQPFVCYVATNGDVYTDWTGTAIDSVFINGSYVL